MNLRELLDEELPDYQQVKILREYELNGEILADGYVLETDGVYSLFHGMIVHVFGADN